MKIFLRSFKRILPSQIFNREEFSGSVNFIQEQVLRFVKSVKYKRLELDAALRDDTSGLEVEAGDFLESQMELESGNILLQKI